MEKQIMKTKGKVSDYVKANRKGSREAELEISVGWTAKNSMTEKAGIGKPIPTFFFIYA